MSEDQPDYLKRKMLQVDEQTHHDIGMLAFELKGAGVEPLATRAMVARCAVRTLRWYFSSCRKAGYTDQQIWGDVTGVATIV